MSAFKRYKSKVFWDQMAYLDGAEAVAERPIVQSPRPRNHEYESHEEEEEEDEDPSSITHDTFDKGDVTAIRVCPDVLRKSRSVGSLYNLSIEADLYNASCFHRDSNSSREDNRCCSSMSQEFRSQDSGFSDTDRSHCSLIVVGDKQATKKPRKRKKYHKERKLHPKILGSLWLDESDLPDLPAHSSTPKDAKRQNHAISCNRK